MSFAVSHKRRIAKTSFGLYLLFVALVIIMGPNFETKFDAAIKVQKNTFSEAIL